MNNELETQISYEGATLLNKRRCGNTSRVVDNAIQIIMSGKICVVRDHPRIDGDLYIGLGHHQYIFRRILERLKNEYDYDEDNLYINHKHLTIEKK